MTMGGVVQEKGLVVVGVLLLAGLTAGYPRGAPPKACAHLIPGHGAQAPGSVPFVIDIEGSADNTYTLEDEIKVRIRPLNGSRGFRGLLMQMRQYDSMDPIPVGTWRPLANGTYIGTRNLMCNDTDDSVTHITTDFKYVTEFMWRPPPDLASVSRFQVRATVAEGKSFWWKDITSDVLTYSAGMVPCPAVPALLLLLSTVAIHLLI